MEITIGFIIGQIIIALTGYVIRQRYNVNIGYVILGAIGISLVIPLFTLDSQELVTYYVSLIPSHVIGAIIGNATNAVIHWIRGEW